ncbi:aminotransferase class I and II [mine drainage metagenome]|uniref:Aminotransferase class I and II n=1 Tax=mine drainage metagenome TaxID=410659 RepID=T0YFV7_9ZZZZ
MNPNLDSLLPYPFERLARLIAHDAPPDDRPLIRMSIGEPRHPAPPALVNCLKESLDDLGRYPTARGEPELREAIASWATRRFSLKPGQLNPTSQILPVSGTREGLFAIAQTVIDPHRAPVVAMPNPFYQIYEGAAILAGAQPVFLNTFPETGYVPNLDAIPGDSWKRCQLLYLCSPGNPTGAILDLAFYDHAFRLADQHGFVVVADECYSELYNDETRPPLGMLEAAQQLGRDRFEHMIVFHSLSKRSSVPGLRSGFVAGDRMLIEAFHRYRTYHGCALPTPVQQASVWAWRDENHVISNRERYRQKFQAAGSILSPVLPLEMPPAGFYLWPEVPDDEERFAQRLYAEEGVLTLPGTYLSRPTVQGDPGKNRIRISLVPDLDETREALIRIRHFVERHY